jgi:hypothetical protein
MGETRSDVVALDPAIGGAGGYREAEILGQSVDDGNQTPRAGR